MKFKLGDIVIIKDGHPEFMNRHLLITSAETVADYDYVLHFITPPHPDAVEHKNVMTIVSDENSLILAKLTKLESLVYKNQLTYI